MLQVSHRESPRGVSVDLITQIAPLALALLSFASLGCGEPAAEGEGGPPAPTVGVLAIESEVFTERVDMVGELRAVNSVEIKPEIDGVIEKMAFKEGQLVEAGTVLFRLRDGEQRARSAEARARVALAKDQFERTQRLAKRNAAAEAQLERRRAELDMARAQLDLASVELERTKIVAPFSGNIGPCDWSPGARVTADDVLVSLDTIDPIDLRTTVAEWALPLIEIGAHMNMTVAAFPDRVFPAEIVFIAPSVERTIRRVPLKARAKNTDGALRPGMFADIKLELGSRETIMIPEEAVMNDPSGSYVWRINDEELVERADIEVGARDGSRIEVREGLVRGERVVTAGTHKVFPGAKVNAVAANAPLAEPVRETAGRAEDGDGA